MSDKMEAGDWSASNDEENDRETWLALELHDGLLQWILSARMTLQAMQDVSDRDQPAYANASRMLEAASEEGRQLIQFLEKQAEAETVDLLLSVNAFLALQQFELVGNQQVVNIQPNQEWPRLSPRRSWNLLRIVQQAIQNAMQHAGPCTIEVSSELDGDAWKVRIVDDGAGFELPLGVLCGMHGHFGLPGMRHRAKLMKASCHIEASIGNGHIYHD